MQVLPQYAVMYLFGLAQRVIPGPGFFVAAAGPCNLAGRIDTYLAFDNDVEGVGRIAKVHNGGAFGEELVLESFGRKS